MKYGLFVVLLLAGCSTPQERIAEYKKTCAEMGFKENTHEHAQCVQQMYSNNQKAAMSLINRRPQNVRVVP